MKVVLIGSGNTATALGKKIKDAGHTILQVYSRRLINATELADQLGCAATDRWNEIMTHAELYLVALSDKALTDLSNHWQTKKGIVVHTAGGVSKDVLKNVARNYGVLYPLQSLRKEKKEYDTIPLLVDASSEDDLALIKDFAEGISTLVREADETYRMHLHVAAVVVNNFTNHLYTLAEEYCNHSNVSFELLKPLIIETAERIQYFSPAMMQTGPASRGDNNTLVKHMDLLKDHTSLLTLYKQLTESIQASMTPGKIPVETT